MLAQPNTESPREVEQRLVQMSGNLSIRKSARPVLKGQAYCDTFLIGINAFTSIDIEKGEPRQHFAKACADD